MTAGRIARVAVLVALLFAVLIPTGVAQAAPYTGGASLTVTSSDPCIGGRNTYSGAGFQPGETVTLTIGGKAVGTATADRSGAFTLRLALPSSYTGTLVVTATGAKASASTTITVVRSCSSPTGGAGAGAGSQGPGGGAGVQGAGASQGGGSPASTGVAIGALLVVALVLLGGGAFLVVTGRRRSR